MTPEDEEEAYQAEGAAMAEAEAENERAYAESQYPDMGCRWRCKNPDRKACRWWIPWRHHWLPAGKVEWQTIQCHHCGKVKSV